jgi:hypothetical protein
MTQKVIANTVHSVVGDVESSTDVVTSISCLLAEHSLCYDIAGKPDSKLFVVHAHPNISVFDSILTHSLLSVLEKHGNAVPLVAELASALFFTNGNEKAYQAFMHLEELQMLPKENLSCLGLFKYAMTTFVMQQVVYDAILFFVAANSEVAKVLLCCPTGQF